MISRLKAGPHFFPKEERCSPFGFSLWLLETCRGCVLFCLACGLLSGIVAMDETFFGAPGKGKHGRGTGKSSVLVALSKDEQGRPQYMRFSVADVTQKSIQSFLTKCVAPGSTIQTDGLNLYRKPLAEAGYSHQVFENKEDSDALKWVHTILANAKAFIQGTYHGLGAKYLQEYLDEFTYRLNRRTHPKELFPRFVTAVASSHILGADD